MNFPVVIQQKRKWNTSSTWTLLYNKRLKVKRDQGIGESREGLVRGRVGKQEPLSWDSCLLLRGEKGRPLQATWGKELWGSSPPFLRDTISLTANPLILWLLVSFPHFYAMIYRQLMNAESRSNGLSMGRAHQWVIQYKRSALKTSIQATPSRLRRICLWV